MFWRIITKPVQRPTILLYAHHDVQPPLRDDIWQTPAYEPDIRDGRMYGRGSADDKAGVAAIAAACKAWLSTGDLVNVTVLIEDEEEIGSPNLEKFVADHLDDLRADTAVIADLVNVQTGIIPSELARYGCYDGGSRSPHQTIAWRHVGRPRTRPTSWLSRMLASLANEHGELDVPGLNIPQPDPACDLGRVPFDADTFRQQAACSRRRQSSSLTVQRCMSIPGTNAHQREWYPWGGAEGSWQCHHG